MEKLMNDLWNGLWQREWGAECHKGILRTNNKEFTMIFT
jgi:hypothetical protein